ncbi:Nicotinamidase [Gracilariopsis chorda]|uniref:nicotinamidase n=1 Tax=Gracilariopsis chorda TaxID=448386 RepID=A0A2V3J6Q9_9FLOR|nr:Nicotinamidase [Gracilariopsis chorda]|eukprot:PXF49993.1 Nicotinamidase [Gracilariopsis chorda]
MTLTHSALLVVDVQNDFLPTGALPVPDGDGVVPIINALMSRINFGGGVFMSKDWHPPNHTSFASNHNNKKPFEQQTFYVDETPYVQTLWPDHCVQNSPGALFAPSLQVPENAVTILKGMDPRYDSYSAFFDNARNAQSSLQELLKKASVRTVYVCGLALDVCVLFTVMDALDLGFETVLLLDACVS